MLIVALSCLMTVVVLRVHFKGKYGVQLSERVRKYFLIPLTKITFIDLKKYSLHPMKTKVSYNMASGETFGGKSSDLNLKLIFLFMLVSIRAYNPVCHPLA